MGNGDSNSANRRLGWVEQRRIMILDCETIMNELCPCPTNKLVAEIEYQTGLSHGKAMDILNLFLSRGTIRIVTLNKIKVVEVIKK